MSASTYFKPVALDRALPSATYYVSLHTGDPGVTGASELSTSGTGYARQAVTFASASGGSKASSSGQTFGPSSSSWGTLSYWGLWDAASGGNFLVGGAVTSPPTVGSSEGVTVASGALSVTAS